MISLEQIREEINKNNEEGFILDEIIELASSGIISYFGVILEQSICNQRK